MLRSAPHFRMADGGKPMLTPDMMLQMWPLADRAAPGLLGAIAAQSTAVFRAHGLTSGLLIAHAMAQFSHECGAGTALEENLNYSAHGLMSTWPARFDAAKAAAFANDPRRIANEVYGGRMGNRPGTDDGWTFRGRGGIQLTGRDGYASLGRSLGLDLLGTPGLVSGPAHFLECAVAKFAANGCIGHAAADDIEGVTLALNGGQIGIAERTAWLARWKRLLGVQGGGPHDTRWVQESLNRLGADPAIVPDGGYGPLTSRAIRAFQLTHGLDADGRIGPATTAALEQAVAGLGGGL